MAAQPISVAAQLLGERIRDRRNQLGLTQEKAAPLCKVHWTFLGQVERGQRNVSLHNITKIAEGLEVDPGDLMRGLPAPPD